MLPLSVPDITPVLGVKERPPGKFPDDFEKVIAESDVATTLTEIVLPAAKVPNEPAAVEYATPVETPSNCVDSVALPSGFSI